MGSVIIPFKNYLILRIWFKLINGAFGNKIFATDMNSSEAIELRKKF